MTITHLLLDIEGTTCPVTFVAEVLFPYASDHLEAYLKGHGHEPAVQILVAEVERSWAGDQHEGAQQLRREAQASGLLATQSPLAVVPYLRWLIRRDVKFAPLKDLQGRIWREGYGSGAIVAPLFDDVPEALQRWQAQGLVLAVYSSGSVPAQQLLYGHSEAGDLRPCFQHWFDTRSGSKLEAGSYSGIAAAMGVPTQQVLFISDALGELEAAHQSGMAVLFSDRDGNPARDCGPFERIRDYSLLRFSDAAQRP